MVRYFGGRTQTSAAFAAWTLVCNQVFNLDEALNK